MLEPNNIPTGKGVLDGHRRTYVRTHTHKYTQKGETERNNNDDDSGKREKGSSNSSTTNNSFRPVAFYEDWFAIGILRVSGS